MKVVLSILVLLSTFYLLWVVWASKMNPTPWLKRDKACGCGSAFVGGGKLAPSEGRSYRLAGIKCTKCNTYIPSVYFNISGEGAEIYKPGKWRGTIDDVTIKKVEKYQAKEVRDENH